jgi:osmotically-inducible protein OsmY
MNHTVNLSGIVPNDMLKQKVIDIAKNTGGVTSVVATQLEVVKN